MTHKDIATPNRTKEILRTYGLSAKKSLGQNFIIDTNILRNIVEAGEVSDRTTVIEVGPGIGALTEQLAKQAGNVIAFEIDDRLLPVLADTLSPYDNIEIIHEDILNVDLEAFYASHLKDAKEIVVVANLPYYITTPIIIRFLESQLPIDRMVLMMQKEVASRLSAQPSTKAYGSLSIAVQYYMDAEVAFTVPKTVFMPQPNVDSAIIRLSRKATMGIDVKDEELFFTLTRAAFVQRRKTLWNNLQVAFGKKQTVKEKMSEALTSAGIDPKRRGETLSIEEFGRMSNAFSAAGLSRKDTAV
ncbi:16S rRNA (adenine1518-N6/adenine1519-N6)-dimethyltransferase [Alkalibacterium subtropicum]|uniref:Ribosomal RNA small subunit methyltransferase A n=1 Tax=Alkalibacterium subtropicum TaxID=753702 RepID=A0A1I1FCG0_9LACT|nr:16S rRNA (adenine(1518)-N(6)/adenine(1519)-N(6))-dimethyltransferase RsmA [Alkalibacterium subtropicum]SFB96636.1 16S rRNA (adenine1518-N6/adenine1519-N6)-dimethyltransferase [Alkalibacterium subtropicum]